MADDETVVEDRGDEVAQDRGDSVAEVEAKDESADVEAEADEATEVEASAEGEEETPEAEADPTAGQMMPFSRFRAQNVKLRETQAEAQRLADELAALKTQPAPAAAKEEPAAPARDFDAEIAAAEKKFEAALNDNDAAAQVLANREIRTLERAQDKAEYDARLAEVQNQSMQAQEAVAAKAFEDTLDMVERDFPQIDPTSETFNQQRRDLVQDLVRSYEAQGTPSEDALLKAVAMAFPESEMSKDLLGTGEAKAEEAPAKAKGTKAAPNRPGIKDKIAAAKSTPPDLDAAGGGENSDAAGMKANLDVSKLSEEDFDALPPETLARLRGDTVAA